MPSIYKLEFVILWGKWQFGWIYINVELKLILFMWNVINDQYYYTLKESNVIQNKEDEVHAIDKTYCTQTLVVSLLFRKTRWIIYFLV